MENLYPQWHGDGDEINKAVHGWMNDTANNYNWDCISVMSIISCPEHHNIYRLSYMRKHAACTKTWMDKFCMLIIIIIL